MPRPCIGTTSASKRRRIWACPVWIFWILHKLNNDDNYYISIFKGTKIKIII